jgi:hypothetical protein
MKLITMECNACAQEEGLSDALMAKGHPDMPTDYKTVIPDDGQVTRSRKETSAFQEGKCQGSCLLHFGIQVCKIESHDQQG